MDRKAVISGNLIKEINYKKILRLIGKGEDLTKLDIAYALGISIPTVATNVNKMKAAGIIEEIKSKIYTGGRRPKVIKLIPNARISLGISITKYRIIIVGINLLNEIIINREIEFEGKELKEYLLQAKKLVDEIVIEVGAKQENVLGIGITIADEKLIPTKLIYDLFTYKVYIENEANVCLLAERSLMSHPTQDNLIYVCINETVGSGNLINGELFRGSNGRAGNLGNMRLLEKKTGKAYKVEDYISAKSLVLRYKYLTGENIKSFLKFEKLIQLNDRKAYSILEEGIDALMMAIYNVTMILDIQQIIIGGKVGRLIKSQSEALQLITNKYSESLEKLDLEIRFSDVKNSATRGAALLPLIEFYKEVN